MTLTTKAAIWIAVFWIVVALVRMAKKSQTKKPTQFRILRGKDEKDWRDAVYLPKNHRRKK